MHELLDWPGPLTHRQAEAWREWLDADLDNPNRTENYLMQIACEVRRVLSKKPNSIQLRHFKLDYKRKAGKKLTATERKAKAREHLAERVAGSPVVVKFVDRDGNPVDPPKDYQSVVEGPT